MSLNDLRACFLAVMGLPGNVDGCASAVGSGGIPSTLTCGWYTSAADNNSSLAVDNIALSATTMGTDLGVVVDNHELGFSDAWHHCSYSPPAADPDRDMMARLTTTDRRCLRLTSTFISPIVRWRYFTTSAIIIIVKPTKRIELHQIIVRGKEPLKTRGALSLSTVAAAAAVARDIRPAHTPFARARPRSCASRDCKFEDDNFPYCVRLNTVETLRQQKQYYLWFFSLRQKSAYSYHRFMVIHYRPQHIKRQWFIIFFYNNIMMFHYIIIYIKNINYSKILYHINLLLYY